MATVLEEYTTEEHRSAVRFYGGRKTQWKELFPVYGENCLSRKAVHNLVAKIWLMTKRLKWR
jgi:hypothetical protein